MAWQEIKIKGNILEHIAKNDEVILARLSIYLFIKSFSAKKWEFMHLISELWIYLSVNFAYSNWFKNFWKVIFL